MKRYGKPIGDIFEYKTHFWEKNDEELKKRQKTAEVYTSQPQRDFCKICSSDIKNFSGEFEKMSVKYRICDICGHLNGIYQETISFIEWLYSDEENTDIDYGGEYIEEASEVYQSRLQDIYLPKANFLFDALEAENEDPTTMHYTDFGAGAGYMMAAIEQKSATSVSGYEVSSKQVDHARAMNKEINIDLVDADEIYDLAQTIEADVVTMIGVIEHLRYPVQIMQSLDQNPDVRYVFCTFPMFSPSVFFEMAFPNVMPRHLTLGHTHLFQESSIDWLCKKANFDRRAEWWFGQDIIDMVRSVEVTVQDASGDGSVDKHWREMMYDVVDELQETLDRKQRSSSVHMLLKSQ